MKCINSKIILFLWFNTRVSSQCAILWYVLWHSCTCSTRSVLWSYKYYCQRSKFNWTHLGEHGICISGVSGLILGHGNFFLWYCHTNDLGDSDIDFYEHLSLLAYSEINWNKDEKCKVNYSDLFRSLMLSQANHFHF
jgi:hypothetical protein